MTETNPLQRLDEHGQSFWIDTLDRPMIRSGRLRDMVQRDGLRGVTTNPEIFRKAISSSDVYDDEIHELARDGRPVGEIYETIAVRDVQDACDVLAPVYRKTDGVDGFVSLEVSPYVAHDARATLEEVHRLHAAVDRPNVFIKIPGTEAGLTAIEEALHAGVNVNVTLLFDVERYRLVAEAYVRAVERQVAEGLAVDRLASVASFFLSRIDVLADRLLGHRIGRLDPSGTGQSEAGPHPHGTPRPPGAAGRAELPQHLLGRAAIANARVAHQVFLDVFSGERWTELSALGARVQRLLWASTGNKNPLYDELRYVEPLIGPDTVNTMPLGTAEAFREKGTVADTLSESGPEAPRRVLVRLAEAGVPIERVTARLEDEAVQKFVRPFDELMTLLAERRDEVVPDATGVAERLGEEAPRLGPLLEALQEQRVPRRLFDLDASLWASPGVADGRRSEHMGWLTSLDLFARRADEIHAFADQVRRDGLDRVLLLGMGGSSLSADAFARALGAGTLRVLDDTHPAAVLAAERALDLSRTLVIVASKSGTTLETLCLHRHFLRRIEEEGVEEPARRFVAITDPGTPLSAEAERAGFRHVFENPEDIGGRYSALSYFGLVPMALLGMDVGAVLESARRMRITCDPLVPATANPAIRLGALLGGAARRGRDKVTLELHGALAPFGDWIEQLLAESTGKRGRGLVPVVGEPEGAPEEYGHDRLFVQMRMRGSDGAVVRALDERARALADAGHPVVSFEVASLEEMGGEILRWELATATAAAVLGVNPFDQPDVELTKRATEELLATGGRRPGKDAEREHERRGSGRPDPAEALRGLLDRAQPGGYAAVLAYVPVDEERAARLSSLRGALRRATGLATTLGYGPRYLHSTGQLHKGGPDDGLFVLLAGREDLDVPIPDTPYGFGGLHRAQLQADRRALTDLGRHVVFVDLGSDVDLGLAELVGAADELAEGRAAKHDRAARARRERAAARG